MLPIGNPNEIRQNIRTLHNPGLAEIGEWTAMQPTQNEGQAIAILCSKITMP